MTTIALFILDVVLGFIAYMVFSAVFVPHLSKQAAYERLKAKEREELDRQLEVEHYFGAKSLDTEKPVDLRVKKVS